jgi:electron transport complex protein RnfB
MTAIIIFTALILLIALILAISSQKFKREGENPLVDQVNQILPQTQCGQCDYPGCIPYAKAIVESGEAINKCPPGGQDGVDALADLLGVETLEIASENTISDKKTVAFIDEKDCIGCTLCIKACPVDAIVGASKLMTTIIASECTGCELCLPPCPVDCITMLEVVESFDDWTTEKPTTSPKINLETL